LLRPRALAQRISLEDRVGLPPPPKLLVRSLGPRKFCEKSIDPYPSPLWLGQQSSCACDCRNGNGDEEEFERSGERAIFELVDGRKQRESDEADGENVEDGPHLGPGAASRLRLRIPRGGYAVLTSLYDEVPNLPK
jgi:hypothetical protein